MKPSLGADQDLLILFGTQNCVCALSLSLSLSFLDLKKRFCVSFLSPSFLPPSLLLFFFFKLTLINRTG